MSMEDAKKFIELLKTDQDLRNKLAQAKTLDARKAVVNEIGLDFTMEELIQARNLELTDEEKLAMDRKLSSDELEAIAGGGHCGTWITGGW